MLEKATGSESGHHQSVNAGENSFFGFVRKRPASAGMLMVVAAFALAVISILVLLSLTGLKMTTRNAPLVDASMEIKYEISLFHLMFDELLIGDPSVDEEEVWRHLGEAEWYARAMLEGGRNPEGTFLPLDDPALRASIMEVQALMAEIREVAVRRRGMGKSGLAGSAIEQEFDEIFDKVLEGANKVETTLKENISRQLQRYRLLGFGMGALVIVISFIAGAVFLRYERRRVFDTAKLRESEKRFRLLMEHAADAFFMHDTEGRIVEVNRQASESLGYTREELLELSVSDFEVAFKLPEMKKLWKKIMSGDPVTVEGAHQRKDGGKFPVEVRLGIIESGGQQFLLALARDITERKRVEEALKQLNAELDRRVEERTLELRNSEASLANAQRIAHIGNWEWDVDADALWWSDEVYRIFGLTPQESEPTYETLLNYVHPDDREAVDEAVRKSLEENAPYGIDHRIVLPDGAVCFVHEEAEVARDHTGKAVLMSGTVQDITERKQAEEELRRNLINQEIIYSIQRISLEPLSLDEILDQTLDIVLLSHELGFEPAGSIFLVEDETQELVMRAQMGLPESLLETCARFPVGRCLCGRAAETGETVFTNEIDDRHEVDYPGIEPHGHYCAPIKSGGQVLGVLNLYVPEGHQRNEIEDKLVTMVADALAGIIRRTEAEEGLRKLSTAVEQSPATVIITDTEGTIEYVNPQFVETTGYTAEEAIGQNPRILKSEHTTAEEYKELWDTITSGKVWRGEFINKKKNGELHWEATSVSPIKSPDGAITHFLAVKEDITERKRTHEALRKSEAQFRQLVEMTNVISWEADPETFRFIYVSPQAEKFLGYPLDEWYGEDFWQTHIHPEDRDEAVSYCGSAAQRGEDHEFEYRMITADGEEIWMRDVVAVEKENEKVTKLRGIMFNITRRKRAEAALRESEQRVRGVMENVADGVITIDEKGIIESFNLAAERIFGYAADEVVGEKVNMLMNLHDRERHDSYIEAYLRTGRGALLGAGPREVSARRKDGASFPMDLAASEMVLGGKRRFIGVMRDITERKQTQAQLIQSSKLATLGEMATAMAHELNQPLNVIRMAADNTLERIEEGKADAEYLQGKLERISDQIERAARIIDHMRIFGRKADEEPEKFDPRKVVKNALGLMGEQLRLREIGVETAFPEHCRSVLGHASQLEQVVLNLLTNARDVIEANRTSPGAPGIISLSVEDVGSENTVRLIVEDTGSGIPEEVLPRIFEPFYTTKKAGEGTGLGLSVSYGIVRDMGGTIEAANADNGAQFTITLPVVEARSREVRRQ